MTDMLNSDRDEQRDPPGSDTEMARLKYEDRGFAALVENVSDVIVATDMLGQIRYVSPSVERVLGYVPDQVVRRNIFEFVHPEDTISARESFADILAEPGVTGRLTPVRAKHRDGGWRNVEVVGKRLAGDDAVVLSMRDITERKQAEEALRRSEHKLHLYFEQTRLGMIEWDTDSRITSWNPAAEKIFGYTANEVFGRDVTFLVTDESVEFAAHAGVWSMGDMTTAPFTNENITKDGHVIVCEWCNTPLTGADGKVIGITSLIEDVTEKINRNERLAHAQRLEMIGTMASGLAHDLNNILAPITVISQALRYELLRSSAHMRLDALDACARRGIELINNILSLARGSRMERVEVNSSKLFREVSNVIQEVFPKNMEVKTLLPTDIWLIDGNSVELHQVLMNLCLNARDAMQRGGVLTLKARNVVLSKKEASAIPNAQPGPYVEWQISDTGSGIAPEYLRQIFDPFFTTKERGKGTGLGLSVSMRIVKNHGGGVEVDSKIDSGTTFKVYFPAARRQEAKEDSVGTLS
jgi:two-component system cell cycle sensor histidine kinase/response regulator CckA